MPLLLGLLALAGSTILLQVGPNIGILVLGRVLQGISAAAVWIVGLALLADTVPQDELGQTMGIVFVATSLGVLMGPLFGGFLFEKVGYNAVFAIAYVFIGVDVALRLMMIEKIPIQRSDASDDKFELEGAAKMDIEKTVISITAESKKASATSVEFRKLHRLPREETSQIQKRRRTPAMFTLMRSSRQLCCLWGVLVIAILVCQFDSVLPIHVKDTFDWNSTASGLIFLPITLTAFLSPAAGWAVDKYGPRWIAVAGFISLSLFEALLGFVTRNTLGQKILLGSLLALIGISFGLAITPLLVEVTAVVQAKEAQQPGIFGVNGAIAQAYGLFNFAWALGSLIGPIWAGFVNQRAGWITMSGSLAALCLLSSIPVAIWTGGSIFDIKTPKL
jgi:MFS family permease